MVRNISDMPSSVVRRTDHEEEVVKREFCLVCDASLVDSELYDRYNVCPRCRFHYSVSARERIDSLADPGSFKEINRAVTSLDPLSFSSRTSYKQRVFRDQKRTGLTEAAVTGTSTIGGTPAVLVVLDFGFMGGTMGCVVGEKVALALEYAARRKRPVVAVVTSGGRPDPRGYSVPHADGEDGDGGQSSCGGRGAIYLCTCEPLDRPRICQLREPRRHHHRRAGRHRGPSVDAGHQRLRQRPDFN